MKRKPKSECQNLGQLLIVQHSEALHSKFNYHTLTMSCELCQVPKRHAHKASHQRPPVATRSKGTHRLNPGQFIQTLIVVVNKRIFTKAHFSFSASDKKMEGIKK